MGVTGYEVAFTFAGEEYDGVGLEYGGYASSGEGDGAYWMVELSAVLRMLDAADRTGLPAADVRRILTAAIAKFSERSGCCPECDGAFDSYEQALRHHQEALEEHRRHEASMTPESHPYVVSSSGKVHAWDCRTRPGQPVIEHPGGTLQEFVHGDRRFHLMGYGVDITGGSAQRMTAPELTAWLSQRTGVKRCKVCEPALPGAYASEASDVEATARG